MTTHNTRLVYSTETGPTCGECRRPLAGCECKSAVRIRFDGTVRVSTTNKGRNGKAVTLVQGAATDLAGLQALAKQLKSACGSGGAVKGDLIEVQGDQVDKVIALLTAQGLYVKRVSSLGSNS